MLIHFTFILIMIFALPVLAEQEHPLSPTQVEQIPFSKGLDTNTEAMYTDALAKVSHETSDNTEHKKREGLPQFDTTTFTSQLFWLMIAFAILYVFFANKTLPTISAIIKNRKDTIKNDLHAADEISEDVDKIKSEYEQAMSNAYNDARDVTLEIETSVRDQATSQSDEFKEKSRIAIQDLEKKAEQAKEKIKKDLEIVASDISSSIISSLSGLDISEAEIKKAVNVQLSNNNKTQQSSDKKAA